MTYNRKKAALDLWRNVKLLGLSGAPFHKFCILHGVQHALEYIPEAQRNRCEAMLSMLRAVGPFG